MKSKVLIIEDQPILRTIYREALEKEGFQVLEANDGQRGWKLAKQERPRLILLDLVLPGYPGFRVLRNLREDPKTKSIIVLVFSGMAEESHIRRAKTMGAQEFLVKGLNPIEEIVGKVKKYLGYGEFEDAEKEDVQPFRLTVGLRKAGNTELQRHVGVTDLFGCPDCNSPATTLELFPDKDRKEGHWLAAHFVCPKCEKSF